MPNHFCSLMRASFSLPSLLGSTIFILEAFCVKVLRVPFMFCWSLQLIVVQSLAIRLCPLAVIRSLRMDFITYPLPLCILFTSSKVFRSMVCSLSCFTCPSKFLRMLLHNVVALSVPVSLRKFMCLDCSTLVCVRCWRSWIFWYLCGSPRCGSMATWPKNW